MAIYDYVFAELYDRVLAPAEWGGLTKIRREMLKDVKGRVLEIGAGTGVNLPLYSGGIDELVICEPGAGMARKLRKAIEKVPFKVKLIEAGAESIPLDDGSVDTVVSTMVLCSVTSPEQSLAEIARVLKPDGKYIFFEHVRSPNQILSWFQDRLERPWKAFGNGCHCNRDILGSIEHSPLKVDEVRKGHLPLAIPLVSPYIKGTARCEHADAALS